MLDHVSHLQQSIEYKSWFRLYESRIWNETWTFPFFVIVVARLQSHRRSAVQRSKIGNHKLCSIFGVGLIGEAIWNQFPSAENININSNTASSSRNLSKVHQSKQTSSNNNNWLDISQCQPCQPPPSNLIARIDPSSVSHSIETIARALADGERWTIMTSLCAWWAKTNET